MSKSFMDAIKSVVKEGAREKTADGMTKDAAHFRHDLHKVQDAGFKHMVQKDSETSDYAKMFSGDVEKAPDRLGDQRAPEDLNKYVEYNEAKEHKKGCECDDCKSDDVKEETVSEIYAQPGTPAGAAYQKALKGNTGKPALPLQAGQSMKPISDQGKVAKTTNTYKPPSSGAPKMAPGTSLNRPRGNYNPMTGTGKPPVVAPANPMMGEKKPTNFAPGAAAAAKRADMSGGGVGSALGKQSGSGTTIKKPAAPSTMGSSSAAAATPKAPGSETAAAASGGANPAARNLRYTGPDSAKPNPPKPKMKPAAPQVAKAKPSAPKAAAPKAAAPQAPKPSALQRQMQRSRSGRDAAVTGPKRLNQSFEIEINGTSYLVSESHAAAIATFVEKHGMVNEMTAGEFISKEMKHPEKLTAKTKGMKVKQAYAIFKSKERRGEKP